MRNRTMALLSDATVIVEAAESSGTRGLGWESLRLGHPLFLLESMLKAGGLDWPREMMRHGAEVLSDRTIELLFDMLPERSRGERTQVAF